MNRRKRERRNEWSNESKKQWMSECLIKEWINKREKAGMNEAINQWTNEWMIDWKK
jgi:hypothetical protein